MSGTEQAAGSAGQAKVGRLLLMAVVVGVFASLGAVAFVTVEHQLQAFLWTHLPETFGWAEVPWYWVLGMLLTGALLTFGATRLPGRGGHQPLDQMKTDTGPGAIGSVILAALASLSFGAVLGPEAPLMAIGAATAAALFRHPHPGEREILMAAGGVAGMGMILGNPLITAILVLEGAALIGSPGGREAMTKALPVLVALGFGYTVQVGVGDWGGFGESVLAVPGLPAYENVQLLDTVIAIPMALVVALVTLIALRIGGRVHASWDQRPLPTIVMAAVVVAVLAIAATAVTGQSVDTILFSGQSAIPEVLAIGSVGTLLVIGAAKTLAYGFSLGGGFRGGRIFPAVYLGVVTGVMTSLILPDSSVSALVAAGVAAGAGAALQLPFTSTLLAVLLCSGAGLAITTTAIIGAIVGVLVRSLADVRSQQQRSGAPEPAGATG